MADGAADELTLQQAADRLGVHYMTAYRYVRTGRLPARRSGGEWRIRVGDLDRFGERPAPNGRRGSPRWSDHVARLRARLVTGDEAGAWQVMERAMVGGAEPVDLYVRILGPALRWVGEQWALGELAVEDEHRATGVATRLIGRLGPTFVRRGRPRGTVVVGAAPGDPHSLPTAMLADVLRAHGYAVVDLGASTPVESFVSAARRADGLVAVGVSASTAGSLAEARSVARTVRDELPGVPLLLGGPAVRDEDEARALGADGWAVDAASAALVLESLRGRAPGA